MGIASGSTTLVTIRARAWALPYVARYPEAFRGAMKLGGTIESGACSFDEDARIIRLIPDWPGYYGFYIVRHVLSVTTRGTVDNVE